MINTRAVTKFQKNCSFKSFKIPAIIQAFNVNFLQKIPAIIINLPTNFSFNSSAKFLATSRIQRKISNNGTSALEHILSSISTNSGKFFKPNKAEDGQERRFSHLCLEMAQSGCPGGTTDD
jgi:hypothetical protein